MTTPGIVAAGRTSATWVVAVRPAVARGPQAHRDQARIRRAGPGRARPGTVQGFGGGGEREPGASNGPARSTQADAVAPREHRGDRFARISRHLVRRRRGGRSFADDRGHGRGTDAAGGSVARFEGARVRCTDRRGRRGRGKQYGTRQSELLRRGPRSLPEQSRTIARGGDLANPFCLGIHIRSRARPGLRRPPPGDRADISGHEAGHEAGPPAGEERHRVGNLPRGLPHGRRKCRLPPGTGPT